MNYRTKEEQVAYSRSYYLKNKERINERCRVYRAQEANKKSRAEYCEENKEVFNARARERWANDPEFRARKSAAIESRKWSFTDTFTYEMLADMRTQDCFYCGGPGGAVDHLVPKKAGGEDRLDNLVPSCKSCNSKKGTRTLQEFYSAVE